MLDESQRQPGCNEEAKEEALQSGLSVLPPFIQSILSKEEKIICHLATTLDGDCKRYAEADT